MVANWLRARGIRFHHSPNETYTRSHAQKKMNEKKGVSPGFPDLMCLMPKGLVFIELKRRDGKGRESDEQEEWRLALNAAGFPCVVCNGSQRAIEFLEQYL